MDGRGWNWGRVWVPGGLRSPAPSFFYSAQACACSQRGDKSEQSSQPLFPWQTDFWGRIGAVGWLGVAHLSLCAALWPFSMAIFLDEHHRTWELKSLRETETLALLSFFPSRYQLGTSGLQAARRTFTPGLGPSLCPAFMLASATGSCDSCNSSFVTKCLECGVCAGLSPSELPVSLAPSAPQQTEPMAGALLTAELWRGY